MSKSYRRPYCAVCGTGSAQRDKTIASRCYRRLERYRLKHMMDPENYLHPVRREASHNNTYGWNRDGSQSYQDSGRNLHRACENAKGGVCDCVETHDKWIKEVTRK